MHAIRGISPVSKDVRADVKKNCTAHFSSVIQLCNLSIQDRVQALHRSCRKITCNATRSRFWRARQKAPYVPWKLSRRPEMPTSPSKQGTKKSSEYTIRASFIRMTARVGKLQTKAPGKGSSKVPTQSSKLLRLSEL